MYLKAMSLRNIKHGEKKHDIVIGMYGRGQERGKSICKTRWRLCDGLGLLFNQFRSFQNRRNYDHTQNTGNTFIFQPDRDAVQ